MKIFGRKKRKQEELNIAEFDMEEILGDRAIENVNEKMFDAVSRTQYVRTQCEQIIESSKYIEDSKKEYDKVTACLKDIQTIEALEPERRKRLSTLALEVDDLDKEKNDSGKQPLKLPSAKYDYYLAHEDELTDALKKMQNDEQYFQMVKKDLNILEAEKMGLREDIENGVRMQVNLKNISLIFLVIAVIAFIVLALVNIMKISGAGSVLTVVLFLTTVFAVLIFIGERNAVYNVKLSEKKLNRAIVLQNKIKIKYINIVNIIEYQYAKYGVHNSLEFANNHRMFLEDKKEKEKFKRTSGRLASSTVELTNMLNGMGLNDPDIWLSRLAALYDTNEMLEVRHQYNSQRRKLREQIEYNIGRIEDAKNNMTSYIKKNPEYADDIMSIVESYDMDV